ncbi:GIY-YIG nuclease family protein [Uliginosibacterium sp. H3]|uniref:GIY-YIG nuclease family protein n=1 Tax=Uliginosibacterium silvisoli TaxID=3114758 RepID=A0ABU6K1Q5_9RHOO|nr:GIY-YIG nuclease family protein [Uliginosibacterium sp. H3]
MQPDSSHVNFVDVLRVILSDHREGLTPQQIRDIIKTSYPAFYGTASHVRNVEKGHYTDLDHALLAQIYVTSRNAPEVSVDKSVKPQRLSMYSDALPDEESDEEIGTEDLDRLEKGVGFLYVLGTNLFDPNGKEIVKIGITTGDVQARITQLYTTGVPLRFRVIEVFETKNYAELEHALHKLLDPYRINKSREFFTSSCLKYVKPIVEIHMGIQSSL